MGFRDSLMEIAKIVCESKEMINSEEHTKTAFIMPFILALGYDIFNPAEVVPEYTCDVGIKKGERVDYALMNCGHPFILVEAKDCRNRLNKNNISQLYRYYAVSDAKYAILTNGIEYMFFTDSIEKNKMDTVPFYKFDMTKLTETDISVLSYFIKGGNLDKNALSLIEQISGVQEFGKWLKVQADCPTSSFVAYIKNSLHFDNKSKNVTSGVIKQMLGDCLSDIDKCTERLCLNILNNKESFVQETAEIKTKRSKKRNGTTNVETRGTDKEVANIETSKQVTGKKATKADNSIKAEEAGNTTIKNSPTGCSGKFKVKDLTKEDFVNLTGSVVVGLTLNNACYALARGAAGVYEAVLDYLTKSTQLTDEEISERSKGVFLLDNDNTKYGYVPIFNNRFYCRMSASLDVHIRRLQRLITCFDFDTETVYLYALSRTRYQALKSSNVFDLNKAIAMIEAESPNRKVVLDKTKDKAGVSEDDKFKPISFMPKSGGNKVVKNPFEPNKAKVVNPFEKSSAVKENTK